ncbi:hypothetical protein DH2020_026248 [Rehmannia glutinosa]|uniref:RING-type E3 ubiquitin transferase n=1 Tax=Rehmannia glutinosa TaxID=99300 RepID=A0ABR0VYG8_REHGL
MATLTSPPMQQSNTGSFIHPLLISMLGIVGISIAIILYHLFLVKYCIRRYGSTDTAPQPTSAALPPAGVDAKVLETIPIFNFSAVKRDIDQEECVDEDAVRLLPNCKHAFHVTCIDQWFAAHASCPLCRSPIVLDQIANVVPLIDAHNRIGDSNRRISSESSTINGGGRESSSSSPPRAQSFGLLRHCASLVLPPPEDRTPPPRRLKRSLSMDQSISVIDLERINCSSASSLSHFDWVSSNWFRSFSRLRVGKGNNINATILPY